MLGFTVPSETAFSEALKILELVKDDSTLKKRLEEYRAASEQHIQDQNERSKEVEMFLKEKKEFELIQEAGSLNLEAISNLKNLQEKELEEAKQLKKEAETERKLAVSERAELKTEAMAAKAEHQTKSELLSAKLAEADKAISDAEEIKEKYERKISRLKEIILGD